MILAGVVVEICCAVTLLVVGGDWSYSVIHSNQQVTASGGEWPAASSQQAVHPYVGYVLDPDAVAGVNPLGFPGSGVDIPRRAPGRTVVAITGGSVAMMLHERAGDRLRQELERRMPATQVDLCCLAVLGHKQPQQVMAVNYLGCLGAEFDVVVNLDGFNEIAFPPTVDRGGDTFDAYPSYWTSRLPVVHDARELQVRLEAMRRRSERRELAARLSRPPWKYSAALLLYWRCRDQMLANRLNRLAGELADYLSVDRRMPYSRRGPSNDWTNRDQRLARLADHWELGSRQLQRVCDGMDAVYIHALQPNQYVPDSKPFTDEERSIAVNPNSGYIPLVRDGYALLQERGRRMRADGIRFVDLTRVFADTRESAYGDECCHLTARGNQVLADRLAGEIARALFPDDASAD